MTKHAATDAVSELLAPARMTIDITPTVRYRVTAPCLLRQLASCVMVGQEKGTRGVFGSRAPLNADVLDLWYEIVYDTHAWARTLGGIERRDPGHLHPIPWVGRLLRTVAATAISRGNDEMADRIEHNARDWTRRIKTIVTGTPEQRGIYGQTCPECGERHVSDERDGERLNVPAVVLVVRELDDRPLRWLACRACGWNMPLGEDAEGLDWAA